MGENNPFFITDMTVYEVGKQQEKARLRVASSKLVYFLFYFPVLPDGFLTKFIFPDRKKQCCFFIDMPAQQRFLIVFNVLAYPGVIDLKPDTLS